MELRILQRELQALIRSPQNEPDHHEGYLGQIATSQNLLLVREVVEWWREWSLERYCILTSRLLKKRGLFEKKVAWYISNHPFSPFIEELGKDFLTALGQDSDRDIANIARFELALIQGREGSASVDIKIDENTQLLLEGLLLAGEPRQFVPQDE